MSVTDVDDDVVLVAPEVETVPEDDLVDPADPTRFRSAGTSTGPEQVLGIGSLGVEMAGGPELVVRDDGQRWPTTAEAFQQARDEAARADREAAHAERLLAQLRAAGIDPDA